MKAFLRAFCVLCGLSLPQWAPATVLKLKPIQVAPHSWYVQGEPGTPSAANQGMTSNAGFVVTRAGVVVFDALGTPALGEALIAAIRSVTRLPIRRVIVSHYHADHFYGLPAFKAIGAEIWAHRGAGDYLQSNLAQQRLAERRQTLSPWVDENTRLVPPDRWLDADQSFELGGIHFRVARVGPAHSPEDLIMEVKEDGVTYVGDIIFGGRLPFVGEADSKAWIAAIDRVLATRPVILVPGHGAASRNASDDLSLTRDYLLHLREVMGKAVRDFVPFDEALAGADWSRFDKLPAFQQANRLNAYGTYLLMEREALGGK